jgi:hypothetical protein
MSHCVQNESARRNVSHRKKNRDPKSSFPVYLGCVQPPCGAPGVRVTRQVSRYRHRCPDDNFPLKSEPTSVGQIGENFDKFARHPHRQRSLLHGWVENRRPGSMLPFLVPSHLVVSRHDRVCGYLYRLIRYWYKLEWPLSLHYFTRHRRVIPAIAATWRGRFGPSATSGPETSPLPVAGP